MDEPLVTRMRPFTSTIFAEMTALATRTGAINLGQGFPDTDGPRSMLTVAADAIRDGVNQYPPGPGRADLRTAIAEHRFARYGLDYDPDREVLVTVGATEGVAAAVLALVEPGDEVVVFEPFYDSYAAVIALAGGELRPVALRPDAAGAFTFDEAELRAAVGPRTRLILVNSPHNPTGAVFGADELAAIAAVCTSHDLIAVTDEVYEHLTFDGRAHLPLASLPGMAERTVSVSSAGKTFAVTGWKTGWVMAPEPLLRAVLAVKQFLTFTASGAYQTAVAHALRHELDWAAANRDVLQANRDALATGLTAAGFRVYLPAGTYFVQADIRPLGFDDGVRLCRVLPERAGVVAVPTQVFYQNEELGRHLVRFAVCKRPEVVAEAVARLAALR